MPDPTPMIALAAVLILAFGGAGYATLRHWRQSRTPTPQDPPELANERWLRREAKNAERHVASHRP